MKHKILIIDQDTDVVEQLGEMLRSAGYEVFSAADGSSGLTRALTESPALIVLDAVLPVLSGIEVTRQIRRVPATRRLPVIMLTARATEQDRVSGLEAGVDDYIVKPFSEREILLRINRSVGRAAGIPVGQPSPKLEVGGFQLDELRHEVRVGGEFVDLTPLEFKLISLLMQNVGFVLERDRLLDQVWGFGNNVTTRTVDTHVMRLRAKLGEARTSIETVRGVGYRLKEAEPPLEFPPMQIGRKISSLAAA